MAGARDPYVFSEPPVFEGGTQRDRDDLVEFYHRLRRANDALDGEQLRKIWSTDPDAVFFNTNGHAYSHAEADPDAAATPDTLPAPDALARGWNSLCGNSRKKLASSRGWCTGNFANVAPLCAWRRVDRLLLKMSVRLGRS